MYAACMPAGPVDGRVHALAQRIGNREAFPEPYDATKLPIEVAEDLVTDAAVLGHQVRDEHGPLGRGPCEWNRHVLTGDHVHVLDYTCRRRLVLGCGDNVPLPVERRDVLAHCVVHRQRALFRQHQRDGACEYLGHRVHAEH